MKNVVNLKKLRYLLFAVLAIAAYYGVSNLFALLAYKVVPEYIPIGPEQALYYMTFVEIIISAVLLLGVWAAFRGFKLKETPDRTPVSGNGVLKCIVCGMGVAGIMYLVSLTGKQEPFMIPDMFELAAMFLFSALFAPLIEELLFRGVIYGFLSKFRSGWFAVVVSAAVFGAYHMDLIQGTGAFFMGIVLAYVYMKTKNIWYSILIHGINNLYVCILCIGFVPAAETTLNWIMVIMIVPMLLVLVKTHQNNDRLGFRLK